MADEQDTPQSGSAPGGAGVPVAAQAVPPAPEATDEPAGGLLDKVKELAGAAGDKLGDVVAPAAQAVGQAAGSVGQAAATTAQTVAGSVSGAVSGAAQKVGARIGTLRGAGEPPAYL